MSHLILDQVINNDDIGGLSNIPAIFALGHYYLNLDIPDYDNAIKILTRAIDHIGDPTGDHKHRVALHRLYYNRACAKYSQNHNFTEAKEDLSRAIHLQSFYKKFALLDDDWEDMLEKDEFIKLTS
jgi:tetratricopeptide (TPR) repeat protein